MNPWQKQRKRSGWSGGFVEWICDDVAYLSVVFSWQLQEAYQRAVWLRALGYDVRAGGPAVTLNPGAMSGVAELGGELNALRHHHEMATFTSRGCPRKCSFCAVPKLEGDLVELTDWKVFPIICDNNFLACSRKHFDQVMNKLKWIPKVDFNQGLDVRLLTKYHAERMAELDMLKVRLAWDDSRMEQKFLSAHQILRDAGFKKQEISVYVLIGWNDSPEDALYRLETIRKLGAWPFPMRYQPLDTAKRNSYVDQNWTDQELKRYARYWSNLRHLSPVPFEEFH